MERTQIAAIGNVNWQCEVGAERANRLTCNDPHSAERGGNDGCESSGETGGSRKVGRENGKRESESPQVAIAPEYQYRAR